MARVFLFAGQERLFDPAAGVGNVPHERGTKSMTKNKPAGHGFNGAAPKNAGANGRFLGAAGTIFRELSCLS